MPLQREPAMQDAEQAHAARMRAHLGAALATAQGWLSFERFMEEALYAPGLGYYSAGAVKLGPDGDFTTAPEISDLFGACLGRQCAAVLEAVGGGSIVEIGAGSGRLAATLLRRLEALGQLPQRYSILEISGDLRERQRRLLEQRVPHLAARVEWLDVPPAASFDGVVIANEVLDALPVRRFRWYSDHVEELGISMQDGELRSQPRPADAALTAQCRRLSSAAGGWDEGYESEYCPRLAPWTAEVTRGLNSGAALWFDYGLPRRQYYLRERREGTLLCHYRHRAHDEPLLHPGLSDITAWVDFTALAEASRAAGFTLAGFTTQGHFLAALQIDREMHAMAGADANRFARLANEARRLMLPGEMGERFKAMAWLRGLDLPLAGFSLQDLRHTL